MELIKLTRIAKSPVYVNPAYIAYVVGGMYPSGTTRIAFVGDRSMSLDVLEEVDEVVALLKNPSYSEECDKELRNYISNMFGSDVVPRD